jgi:N-acetyl-gamma-glutamylphosphate reductase
MARHFPDYELTYCCSLQELTLLQLRRADVIIADISGDYRNPRNTLEQYYGLLNQYRGSTGYSGFSSALRKRG